MFSLISNLKFPQRRFGFQVYSCYYINLQNNEPYFNHSASGMLGCSLAPSLVAAGHQVIRQSRKDGFDVRLNLLNDKDWVDCFNELQPEVIVSLAAATNVDQ